MVITLLIVVISISSYFIYKNIKEDNKQEKIFEEIKDIAQDKLVIVAKEIINEKVIEKQGFWRF